MAGSKTSLEMVQVCKIHKTKNVKPNFDLFLDKFYMNT